MRRRGYWLRESLGACLGNGFALAVGGTLFVSSLWSAIASFQAIALQSTHPRTHARVVSIYEQTYTVDDSQNTTSSERTEICAEDIRFTVGGRDIQVHVSAQHYCGVSMGSQPTIAYNPQQPSSLQCVPTGDPF